VVSIATPTHPGANMKLTISKKTFSAIHGRNLWPGDSVELPDHIAERMIARGEAEQVKAAKRTRSRGPVLSNRAVDADEIETPEG